MSGPPKMTAGPDVITDGDPNIQRCCEHAACLSAGWRRLTCTAQASSSWPERDCLHVQLCPG